MSNIIKSKTFPGTNRLPMDGGSIIVGSDIFDSSLNDNFNPEPDPDSWFNNSSGTSSKGFDNSFYMDFDATGGSFREGFSTKNSPFPKGEAFSFELGYKLNLDPSFSSPNSVMGIYLEGDDEHVEVLIYKDNTDPSESYIDVYSFAENDHTIIPWDLNETKVKFIAQSDDTIIILARSKDEPYKVLKEMEINPTSGSSGYSFSFSANSTQGPNNTGRIYLTGFKTLPVIEYPSVDWATNYPIRYTDTEATLKIDPPYPGEFDINVHGTGAKIGQSETASVKVIQERIKEDSTKFLVSPIEKLYDSNGQRLVCRPFGIPDEENLGSLIVNQECFCDGTSQDGTPAYIELQNNAKLNFDEDAKKNPRFLYTDDEGGKYGRNFEFNRLYSTEGMAGVFSQKVKELKCLTLSDGNRFYYGVQYEPLEGPQQVSINYQMGAPFNKWELRDREDGRGIQPGEDNIIDSGENFNGPDPVYDLEEGRYVFRMYGGELNISQSGPGYSDFTVAEAFADDLEPFNSKDDAVWLEVHFDVKQYRGGMVYALHNICENSFETYEAPQKDVSLVTDSFSAVEIEPDKIAFLYQGRDSKYIWHDLKDSLGYRVVDLDSHSIGSSHELELPGIDSPIWAFDAVMDQDSFNVACSLMSDGRTMNTLDDAGEEIEVPIKKVPNLENDIYTFSADRGDIGANSDDVIIDGSTELESFTPKALKDLILVMYPDYLYSEMLEPGGKGGSSSWGESIAFTGMDRICLDYDEGQKKTVLSTLTHNHRLPFIWTGRGHTWDEISMPNHFTVQEFKQVGNEATDPYADYQNSLPYNNYHRMESFSATFGADGFIYSTCLKFNNLDLSGDNDPFSHGKDRHLTLLGFNCELGVTDPETMDISQTGDFSTEGGIRDAERENDFRFQSIPFMCSYKQHIEGSLRSVNLTRHYNYLIATMGSDGSTFPMIFGSNQHDELPFMANYEDVWLPEYGSVGVSHNGVHFNDGSCGIPSTSGRKIEMSLDRSSQMLNRRDMMAERGYKFHFRAGVPQSNAEFVMEVEAIYSDEDDSNYFESARARFIIFGGMVLFQTFSGIEEEWSEDIPLLEGMGFNDETDYYIFIQRHSERRFRARFVHKNPSTLQSSASGNYTMDHRSEVTFSDVIDITPEVLTSPKSSSLKAGWKVGGAPSQAHVFQMGWNTIKAQDILDININRLDPENVGGEWIGGMGDKWLVSNDLPIFNYRRGYPYSNFITPLLSTKDTSPKFHWPNGLLNTFSNVYGREGDTWEISREDLNNLQYSSTSNKMHGMSELWNEGVMWADAHDSGLEKFSIDTFLIDGADFREVFLLGKDSLGDNWTPIESMDLTRYKISAGNFSHEMDEDEGIITLTVDSADFNVGALEGGDYYLTQWSEQAMFYDTFKVENVSGDKIILKVNKLNEYPRLYSDTDCRIFSAKGVKKLDEPVRYRYIGITGSEQVGYGAEIDSLSGLPTPYASFRCFDFGNLREIPLEYNHNFSTGGKFEMESEVGFVYDDQPFVSEGADIKKNFEFEYSVVDPMTRMKFKSILSKVALSRKPVWVIENMKAYPERIYLSLSEGEPSSSVLVDEDGEKYYTYLINFRSVR